MKGWERHWRQDPAFCCSQSTFQQSRQYLFKEEISYAFLTLLKSAVWKASHFLRGTLCFLLTTWGAKMVKSQDRGILGPSQHHGAWAHTKSPELISYLSLKGMLLFKLTLTKGVLVGSVYFSRGFPACYCVPSANLFSFPPLFVDLVESWAVSLNFPFDNLWRKLTVKPGLPLINCADLSKGFNFPELQFPHLK